MLWQTEKQWNSKETKTPRFSVRLKRDDNIVWSLWSELLTGDNPLKRPLSPVLSHPCLVVSVRSPSPCLPFSIHTDWLHGWTITMPLNTPARQPARAAPDQHWDTSLTLKSLIWFIKAGGQTEEKVSGFWCGGWWDAMCESMSATFVECNSV